MITYIRRTILSTLVFSLALLSHAAVAATEVAGVKYEDTAKVGNQVLKLNGAGIRYKAIFKVYAAGLYLPEKKTTVPAVLTSPGNRRVTMVLLRELTTEELGGGLMSGIRKNIDRAENAKYINQLLKLGEVFATVSELKKGDILTTDWITGTGTVFMLNGRILAAPLPDIGFYNALLRIWLGEKPVDSSLKRLMLGEKPEEYTRSSNN